MLVLMPKWEQHKINKWARSSYVSAYAYAYVAGRDLTCHAYVILMRESAHMQNLVISRCSFGEDGKEMYKDL